MSTSTLDRGTSVVPAESSYPTIDFGPRQSFVRLVRIELRKMVDTRSGRWLLIAILALSAAGLTWGLTHLDPGVLHFTDVLGLALVPVDLILPVVGIMAMTSEWTQRTALTTFTLSPRRIPVLFAKLVAAIALAMAMVTAVVGLAFVATAIGGVIGGDGASYDHALRSIAGAAITDGLNVLMAAGIGLVASLTAVGVLVYYVAPTAWALVGPGLLHGGSRWLDIFATFGHVGSFDLSGHVAQALTSVGFWIVLPVTVGLVVANRREVK
ncbi:MAG: type transport system permease protein [Pseudonocardiales bacterium]|jgi:hypothetical protein|nr:type transport system permease protein [Pseudonocardiales bacterium]